MWTLPIRLIVANIAKTFILRTLFCRQLSAHSVLERKSSLLNVFDVLIFFFVQCFTELVSSRYWSALPRTPGWCWASTMASFSLCNISTTRTTCQLKKRNSNFIFFRFFFSSSYIARLFLWPCPYLHLCSSTPFIHHHHLCRLLFHEHFFCLFLNWSGFNSSLPRLSLRTASYLNLIRSPKRAKKTEHWLTRKEDVEPAPINRLDMFANCIHFCCCHIVFKVANYLIYSFIFVPKLLLFAHLCSVLIIIYFTQS